MKKTEKILLAAVAVVFLTASFCFAQESFLKEANIEYSADEIIVSGGMTIRSKVFYAPGKFRKEQSMEGMQQITIIRQDQGLMWILMPNRMYMEVSTADGKGMRDGITGDFTKDTIVHSVLGEEIVNGVKVTKNKVTVKDPMGGKFEGLMWQSKNGIIVKMETEQMTLELKNLRQEAQDPELFEIPRGYKKMDMPGMGALGSFLK